MDYPLLLLLFWPLLQAATETAAMAATGTLPTWRQPEWTYFAVALPQVAMIVTASIEYLAGSSHPTWLTMVAGSLLSAGGIAIRLRGHYELGGSFTPFVDCRPEQKVVETGLYAGVRHPMYLGSLLTFVGFPLLVAARFAWVLSAAAAIGIIVRIHKEEAMLREKLAGYTTYCEKTFRLLPRIY